MGAGCLTRELTAIILPYETLATGTPEPVVIWDKSFRGDGLNSRAAFNPVAVFSSCYLRAAAAFLLLTAAALPSHGREKDVLAVWRGPDRQRSAAGAGSRAGRGRRGAEHFHPGNQGIQQRRVRRGSGRGHVHAGVSGMDGGRQGFLQGAEAGARSAKFQETAAMLERWPCATWCNPRATRIPFCELTLCLWKIFGTACTNRTGRSKAASTRTSRTACKQLS